MIADAWGFGGRRDAWGEGYNLGWCSCRLEPLMQPLIMMCSWPSYSAGCPGAIFLISVVGTHDPCWLCKDGWHLFQEPITRLKTEQLGLHWRFHSSICPCTLPSMHPSSIHPWIRVSIHAPKSQESPRMGPVLCVTDSIVEASQAGPCTCAASLYLEVTKNPAIG